MSVVFEPWRQVGQCHVLGRGRVFLPAAFETPFRVGSPARPAGIGDHDLGVASTSVRVVVQASPRRSVTRIGVPRSWSFSGSAATRSPSTTYRYFRTARLENRAEVDGQRGVVNRGGPPPGVQARQRAEVGPSGVEADTRVGEPVGLAER